MTREPLERALDSIARERTELLPALLLAEGERGFISDESIQNIASHLRLTVNDVDGVATAYPDLHRAERAPRVVRVCTGLACACAGAGALMTRLREQAEAVGSVAVEETACLFSCAVAPVVEVDGQCYGRVTATDANGLVGPKPEGSG